MACMSGLYVIAHVLYIYKTISPLRLSTAGDSGSCVYGIVQIFMAVSIVAQTSSDYFLCPPQAITAPRHLALFSCDPLLLVSYLFSE